MANLKDIAKLVGVSQVTVSRIMNDKARGEVSSEVVRRVQEAVVEMGYIPRGGGRKCAVENTSSSRLIVFVPEEGYFDNCQGRSFIRSKELEGLEQSGKTPVIRPARGGDMLIDWTQILDITPGDRILLIGTEGVPLVHELSKRGNRCAIICDDYYWSDFYRPQLRKVCRFIFQNSMGIVWLSKVLYDMGCRNIAVVAYRKYMYEPGYRRVAGYERAMSLLELSYRHVIPIGMDFGETSAAIQEAYRKKPFDGLIFSTMYPIETRTSLQEAFGIPASVPVVSTVEHSRYPSCAVPLASLEQPAAQLTRDAVQFLFSQDFKVQDKQYPPEVVFHQSCL